MHHHYDAIIIGSGFAGIASAVHLQKTGMDNFLILERDPEMGGTWWTNTYPGAQVDVPSHLYSFSFEPYDWSRLFAYQHEILRYTNHVIDKYRLREKTRTSSRVTGLRYLDELHRWEVSVEGSDPLTATFVINASGGLSQPNIPTFKGQESYKGKTMHSSRWDHSFDYRNKKVIVIGSAASAIQVAPAIAPLVEHLTIFQRSAHWILPRPDRALTNVERQTFRRFPALQKAYRESLYMKMEGRVVAFRYVTNLIKFFQKEGEEHIKAKVDDPVLQQKITPDYLMGCKRVLLSNDYYPMLNRDNVTLLTRESGIKQFNETGIETIDGRQVDADLIVYATGFHASENVVVYPVQGRGGALLSDAWEHHAHAYLGTMVPNFPNLLLVSGPNTGTGHTSAIGMIEFQLEYVIRVLKDYQKKGWRAIEVKEEVEAAYNKKLQEQLADTVWQTGGCQSWYQTKDGYNTTMYPNFTFLFRRDCKNYKPSDHVFQ